MDTPVFTQVLIFRGCVSIVFYSSIRPSVHPFICTDVSARFSLDGSPWNLILGISMKKVRENPSLV